MSGGGSVGPETVTNREEFAAALTQVRGRAGLSVRELARRLSTPTATLGDYFSGRHVPSASSVPLLRALLAECRVDESEIDRWVDAVTRVRTNSDRRVTRPDVPAPYRGLEPFEPDDAGRFFGREDDTAAIVARLADLRDHPGPSAGILAVIGPSGSGKSSLLRAGVAPAVRAGALGGPAGAGRCVVTTPGSDPLARFAAALAGDPAPDVVVVDQFEEVFTSVPDPAVRAGFLRAMADRPAGVLVVLGMRADFYATAASEPLLLAALQHAQVLVGPMSGEQVRRAIRRPAELAGTTVDDGLVELILADLAPHDAAGFAHDAGALPLLSHALLSTWEHADGRRLTVAAYRATGGLEGAVQQTAEDVYAALTPAEREIARRVFLRLVHLDDDVAITRRRTTPDELRQLTHGAADGADGAVGGAADHAVGGPADDAGDVGTVVDRFVARRLITAGADAVEISHEALLAAWPRLRSWIELDRAGLRLHRQITDGANAWHDAGRDPGLLLRGTRLEAAREWAGEHPAELNAIERDFLAAGAAARAAEVTRERVRRRRLTQALVTVGVLGLVAAVLAVLAFRASGDSDRARRQAAEARDNALSRQVTAQAERLSGPDPALAEQLALAAYRISPSTEARGGVIEQSAHPTMTRVLGVPGPTALAISPDGRVLAVGHADDGTVHLYRFAGGDPPVPAGVVPGGGRRNSQVFALAFSPDGTLLAAGGQAPDVTLWRVGDPAHPVRAARLAPHFSGAVQTVAFSPDGRTLAAGSTGRHPIVAFDVTNPQDPAPLPAPRGVDPAATVQSIAFSPTGDRVAAGGTDGKVGIVLIWPAAALTTATPARRTAGTATVTAVAFDPTRPWVYAGDRGGAVTVWHDDPARPGVVRAQTGASDSPVDTLAVSPDGHRLAVGSADSTLTQYSTADGTVLDRNDNPGPVTGVGFSRLGPTLISTSADGALRLLDASGEAVPVTGSVFNLGFSHDGTRLAVGTNGDQGSVTLWDVRTPSHPRRLGPPIHMPAPAAPLDGTGSIRPDGMLVAGGNHDGMVALWDVADPLHPRLTAPPFHAADQLVESTAFSPDGRLLAVASDDHTARIWDVHDPAHPRTLATVRGGDLMLSVAFSRDSRLLAGANADDMAHVWDVSTPARPRPVAALGGFRSYAYGVAFSPVDDTLAVTSADDTTRLWDLTDRRHPRAVGRPLIGPTDYAYAAAFSPDGTEVAVASNDHTVAVYRVGSGRRVPEETLRTLDQPAFAVAFSPDGRSLVAGGRSTTLATWTLDATAYARRLCPHVGDRITRAEWELYVPGAAYRPPCG